MLQSQSIIQTLIMRKLYQFCFRFGNQITLHADILSKQEIYSAISEVSITPHQRFLDEIKKGRYNEELWMQTKSNLSLLNVDQQIQIVKAFDNFHDTTQIQHIFKNFIGIFKSRLSYMTLPQIARILKLYAQQQQFDKKFFQEVETEIYNRIHTLKENLTVQDAEKILWAYQRSNFGSSILFKDLISVFKIAQFEINPVKLCEYCYIMSKCKENMNGAFGLFKITEERIMDRIDDYQFHDFVKMARFLYVGNIGSNDFQIEIECRLSEKFPKNENISLGDLVDIAKYTSKYMFRFQEKALYHKIEAATLHLIQYTTNKQFSHLVWSFLRSQRGSHQLYESFYEEFNKRLNTLSERQVCLLFKNSCRFDLAEDINSLLLEEIKKRKSLFSTVEKVQILGGLISIGKEYDLQQQLISEMKEIRPSQRTTLFETILKSKITSNILELMKNLLAIEYNYKLKYYDNIVLSYIEYVFFNKNTLQNLNAPTNIKKNYFYQLFHLFPQDKMCSDLLKYLLDQHGSQMRYVFSQDHWTIISWNILVNNLIDGIDYPQEILEQVVLGIKEMDPNMLQTQALIFYPQAVALICILMKWTNIHSQRLIGKIQPKRVSHLQNILTQTSQQVEIDINGFQENLRLQTPQELMESLTVNQNYFDPQTGLLLPVQSILKLSDGQQISICLLKQSSNRYQKALKFILENKHNFIVEFVEQNQKIEDLIELEFDKKQTLKKEPDNISFKPPNRRGRIQKTSKYAKDESDSDLEM